ncbi:MAG: amidohydrolase family protein, partial [Ignavibacteriaceae bacterium]|nr:amidohydrolase family protein [Ignavibacteriaceae bacterium]
MKTIISNAWICSIKGNSVQPVFGNLILDNGKIVEIEKTKFEEFQKSGNDKEKNVYDAAGRVITIPNVNFHEHIYSRLSKGLQINGDTDSFYNILNNLWWKLDRSLDRQMVEASAQMASAESIKNGVTYLFDHHSSPDFAEGSLERIAGVLKKNKLRGVLCFETTDRNGTALSQKGMDENINFNRHGVDENIKNMFGFHASFTVDDSTFKKAADFVNGNDIGIHIHLCEAEADREISKSRFGKLPLQRLIDNNLLNSKSILSHSIHLTAKEYKKIESSGSAIAINPESNLNNAVGINNFKLIPDSVPLLC